MKILNAFSLSMLPAEARGISVRRLGGEDLAEEVLHAPSVESCVGHADTAEMFGKILGLRLQANRVSVKLAVGEAALVGQYSGPWLTEGCTTLPEGAAIEWMMVTVEAHVSPPPMTAEEKAAQ